MMTNDTGKPHQSPSLEQRRLDIGTMLRGNSPFDAPETDRIVRKFFGTVPRLVKLLVQEHGFDTKKVLDIGSSYGQSFFYWGQESEAMDVSVPMLSMIATQGRKTHRMNIEDGFTGIAPASFDAVFTNNLFEHLLAPHLFLARIHSILRPGGLLAIGHPLVPPFPLNKAWNMLGFNGWMEAEHVNFFTPKTSRLTLERGGFAVERQYFSAFSTWPLLARLTVPFGVHCLSVVRKIDDYKYEDIRMPMFDPAWAGDLKHFR